MSIKPVRPVDSVERGVHLEVEQVELRNPRRPLEIRYLFGRIPRSRQGLPALGSHSSSYVIVGELIGLSSLVEPQLFRYRSAGGGIAYVEWGANFRCHRLSLHVTSNLSGNRVKRLGNAILAAEACATHAGVRPVKVKRG